MPRLLRPSVEIVPLSTKTVPSALLRRMAVLLSPVVPTEPLVTLMSGGTNVFSDTTCAPIASDQIVATAALGPLAANGGPTLTHAPNVGSPALDAANPSSCPATDQRGVARPQGPGCDVGSVEQ